MKMKKVLKVLAIVAGAFVAIAIILTLVIAFLVPWDKVKDAIVAESSKVLNREVKIEKIDFSLFKGIQFKNFYIGNKEGFTKGAFVSAESAVADYKFWALFKKQIILTKIELVKPYIIIEKNKDGKFNFSDLMQPAAEAKGQPQPAKAEKPPVKLPFEFSVTKFAISNGSIVYNDLETEPALNIELKNMNIDVTDVSLETVKPFGFTMSTTLYYKNNPIDFSLAGKADIKFNEQKVFLKGLTFKFPGFTGTAGAEIVKFLEDPSFKADFGAKLETEKLVKLVNPLLSPKIAEYMKETVINGEGNVKMKMSGSVVKMKATKSISVSGEGEMDAGKIEVKYSTTFYKKKDFSLGLKYNFDFNNDKLKINADMQTAGSKIKTVNEIAGFDIPKINISADGDFSLPEIFSLLPLMDDFESTGKANMNVIMKLNLTKDYKLDYKSIKMNGKGNVKDFGIKLKTFNYGISKLFSDFTLTEKIFTMNKLAFNAGTSVFNGTGYVSDFDLETVAEWKERFKGDVKFDLQCQKFLVDEIMNAMPKKEGKGSEVKAVVLGKNENPGFTDEEIKDKTKYIYKELKMDCKLGIREMIYKSIKFQDLKSDVKLDNRVFIVNSGMAAYSGSMKNVFSLDLNTPGLGYDTTADISNVNVSDFVNAVVDSFLQNPVADQLKNKVYGATQANMSIKGSGANMKSARKNLTGNVNFKMVNGKLKNWDIISKGLVALKVNPTEEIPFREFYGKCKIGGEKLTIEDFKCICDEARYSLIGDVNFNKDPVYESDLKLKLYNDFSPQFASKLGDAGNYASDENGWINPDLDIGCNIKSPCFTPNLERTLKNGANKLKKKAEEEMKKQGEDVKNKAQDLFKNIFKK